MKKLPLVPSSASLVPFASRLSLASLAPLPPFMRRPQNASQGAREAVAARRPFRLWMTGSLAVVMAAMIPMRDVSEANRNSLLRVLRHSRFGVAETMQRIEAAARGRGLTVLAMMRGERPALVLASSVGGTPVVMLHADSQPAMPLSLVIHEASAGGADVYVMGAQGIEADPAWSELPAAVTEDWQALPSLVDGALA